MEVSDADKAVFGSREHDRFGSRNSIAPTFVYDLLAGKLP